VPGDRGRAVFAVLDTVSDARLTLLQHIYGGLDESGGGLRGGSFTALNLDSTAPALVLRRYAYVPGVRVTGRLILGGGSPHGTVGISGRYTGHLAIGGDGGVVGRLGGRTVRYRPGRARGASGSVPRPPLTTAVAALSLTAPLKHALNGAPARK
jgi:hypothetical protein